MRDIGIGIIGTGFMGKSHGFAYRAVAGQFPVARNPVLEMVADINPETGAAAHRQLGFKRVTADWRELVNDPKVEIVSITSPNLLHREMAGVRTQVGYNYIKNPILKLARDMVVSGELGDIIGFRGIHAEDYMVDPTGPWNWRVDPRGGGGAVADLGSHIIGIARFLIGPIAELSAELETVFKERPASAGSTERRKVEVDDVARLTVRFERGCTGSIEANWVATGRKMHLGFELAGTKGSLVFTQERFNELQYYKVGGDPRHAGFTTIEAGPAHYPYGLFCVAPGHQIGFNDLKTIEVAEFLASIDGGPVPGPDFREAWEIQKIVDTAIAASKDRVWHKIP